jgi:predicted dinucleotide-binding enzyme
MTSVIARELASGGETLRIASADNKSARTLAAGIGRAAVVAVDNRGALQGADAVVLALRFTVLKGVIDEIADQLADKLVVVPSNPLSGTEKSGRLEVGGDLHDLVVGPAEARSLIDGLGTSVRRIPIARWYPASTR